MADHPNVRRFLDLSTAHLSPAIRDLWTLSPDLIPPPGGSTRYGFFIWSGADDLDIAEEDMPAEVKACQLYARSVGCDYILFDADAEQVEGLEVFADV